MNIDKNKIKFYIWKKRKMIEINSLKFSNFTKNDVVYDVVVPNSLLNKIEIKILFCILMVLLCLVTTVGNLIVIYKYKKTFSVC